jgi:hypothetical protein
MSIAGGIDIAQSLPVLEAGDTKQFTMTASPTVPATAAFVMFNTDGSTLALNPVQPNAIVGDSGSGLLYFNRVLPDTPGIYCYKWLLWDSASRPYVNAYEVLIQRTEAFSFQTYGDPQDIVRSARQLFGRSNITFRDMQPYCQAADGFMDMYFGRVTSVPLGSSSPLIQDMSKVYTLWRFYCDQYSYDTKQEPPAIIHRKEDYDRLLELIAAGSMSLPGIEAAVTFEPVALPDHTKKPVFDMRDFLDQHVSRTLIDEEQGRDDGD